MTPAEREAFRASVATALAAECPTDALKSPEPAVVAAMASHMRALSVRLGWTAIMAPEEAGGVGGTEEDAGVLHEELGRAAAPLVTLGDDVAVLASTRCAGPHQSWLPPIVGGDVHLALPASGFDSYAVQSGAGVLARAALVVFGDGCANAALAPVQAEDGRRGLALLRFGHDSVEIIDLPALDRTRRLTRLVFDRVRVRPEDVAWIDGETWAALFDHASLALACDSLGGADAILARTVQYLGVREQFGRVIGSFQALKHRVASWKVLLEACRSLVHGALHKCATGAPDASFAASCAKAYVCDAYAAIAGDAVQLHGGIGFTWAHDCHLYLKRAKLNQTLFGAATLHQDRAARLAFDESDEPGDGAAHAILA